VIRRVATLAGILLVCGGIAPAAEGPAAPAPTMVEQGRSALDAGIDYLIRTQNEDGSWGYHAQVRPYAIYAPVPGAHRAFKVATSALALMALWGAERDDEEIRSARLRGARFLIGNARVKRSLGQELYCIWGFGYGLQALSRCIASPIEGLDVGAARQTAATLVTGLERSQFLDGGWGYFDFNAQTYRPSGNSMSFCTGMILIALHEAQGVGIEVPERMVRQAVISLRRCRTPEGTYVYSFNWRYAPNGLINRPGGSLTRTPCNDLALFHLGRGMETADLEKGVRNLLRKKRFTRMASRRPVPHESWFSVSGYFYLFGYFYAGECCRLLPGNTVAEVRDGLIGEILHVRMPDGSFLDYPFYGYDKPYGTAYAVLALQGILERK
jgi:hypothetical protein